MQNDDSSRPNESTTNTDLSQQSRRAFLRRTTAAAVGMGVLSGFADHARADALPPIVSTRDYYSYERDGQGPGAPYAFTLADGYTETDYELGMGTPGLDAPCDEVAIIVHGWDNNEDNAREKFATAVQKLTQQTYAGRYVGYSWDADISGGGVWNGPRKAANRNGTHLAQFLVDLRNACMNSRIHLLGHSLGARVVLSALNVLNERDDWLDWYKLHSVCLFGAAVDNETPAVAPYDSAIRGETGRTFNFYSTEDDVLSGLYWLVEQDQALGEDGVESGETHPGNYADIDVTSSVGDDHSGYLANISDQISNKMQWG